MRKLRLFTLICLWGGHAFAAKLSVYAAASLSEVLPRVAEAWRKDHPKDSVEFNFDGTAKLAKQIEQGAPADLFLAADVEWMDYLENKGQLLTDTRKNLLQNEIVWIVPASAPDSPRNVEDLKKAHFSKLALAGENVPISKYAKAALEHAGVWKSLETKVIRGENVRMALKWVEEKEADAAVVYRTDALANAKVKIAFVFPKPSYPAVIYPAAVVKGSANPKGAIGFLDFLQSKAARQLFDGAGFK